MPKLTAPSLSPEFGRPLLKAADAIARLAPWEFMSDLELIGMRDEKHGKLHVASILGTLGTLFAVIVYRNEAGRRWIYRTVSTRELVDNPESMEDVDYLKVEWCRRAELQKSDLLTLKTAGFKPHGTAPGWPRFESARPGWYPWAMTEEEASLMTELLQKVARFVHLRQTSGVLHQEPLGDEVPVVPAGSETSLKVEDLGWMPLVPPPAPIPEPVSLSAQDHDCLVALPMRKGMVLEVMAPLTGSFSFVDEPTGLPCIARTPLVVDQASEIIIGMHMAHGAASLAKAVGPAIVQALTKAGARPETILVDWDRLVPVLRPACEALGVSLVRAPLRVAPRAWESLEEMGRSQRPR